MHLISNYLPALLGGPGQYATYSKAIRAMKLTFVLMTAAIVHVYGASYGQTITFSGRDVPATKVFHAIERQTGYVVFCNKEDLKLMGPVTLSVQDMPLTQFLHLFLQDQPVDFIIDQKTISLSRRLKVAGSPQLPMAMAAPDTTISGTVRDPQGQPLPGVTVSLEGTTTGSVTDANGQYSLESPTTSGTLIFTSVGYTSQRQTINHQTQVNAVLAPSIASLDQLVVVGYGTQKKREITGSASSISANTISKRPITEVGQALQGAASGVAVTSANGQPGTSPKVQIRGANSITGNTEPLYVTDGNIGVMPEDPNDIASIEVLKDAAATAIYGSRASNGVVLITTKTGEPGKMRVNFNTWFRHDQMPRKLDLMNAYDFARSVNNQFASTGSTAAFSDDQLEAFRTNGGTDWQDAVFAQPWVRYYGLNVSGGSEAVRYRVSLSHLDQPGTIVNTYFKRTSFRSNLDAKLNDRMNIKLIVAASIPQIHNNGYGGGLGDPFNQAVEWDPTSPIRDPNTGEYIHHSSYASIQFNPVEQAMSQAHDGISQNLHGNLTFTYKILDDLTFTSTDVYTIGQNYNQNLDGPGTSSYDAKNGSISNSTSRTNSYLSSNFLTYQHEFGDHSITATALYEASASKNMNFSGTAKDMITYALGYYNLGLGSTQQTNSGYTADALVSWMGRINYAYKHRYFLTASFRTDGSSHLTNKWSSFPSVGIAWDATQENFLKNSQAISLLKFRASYGKTGNQNVGAYSTIVQIQSGGSQSYYFYDGTTQSVATPLGTGVTKTLRWETKDAYDVGADVAFLQGRLEFTADFYWNKIEDLLYSKPVPYYDYGGTYQTNIGNLTNNGAEFSLSGTPVTNSKITWNTHLNVSFNRNKVVSLGGLDSVITGGFNNTVNAILVTGKPLGEFYGYRFLGTWKSDEADQAAQYGMKPGDAKYQDINGDNAYTSADYQLLGNATPKFTFGFANDITWHDLTLSFLFQGQYGSKVFSQTLAYLWGGLGDMKNATIADAVPENLWSPEHETNNPAWSNSSHNYNNSSRYVYNSSYVKLKNLSLAYNIPQPLLDRFKIRTLQVYVSAQNMWVLTPYKGYDPEIENNGNAIVQGQEFGIIPNPKSFTFGLRLGL